MRYGHIVRRARAERPDYNALKSLWQTTVAAYAKKQGLPARAATWRFPVSTSWRFYEPDAHRDPDGIAGGARKLILDGLVMAGVLPTDTHRHVGRTRWEEFYVGATSENGARVEGVSVGLYEGEAIAGVLVVPAKLPDLNELLAARELGARRSKAVTRG